MSVTVTVFKILLSQICCHSLHLGVFTTRSVTRIDIFLPTIFFQVNFKWTVVVNQQGGFKESLLSNIMTYIQSLQFIQTCVFLTQSKLLKFPNTGWVIQSTCLYTKWFYWVQYFYINTNLLKHTCMQYISHTHVEFNLSYYIYISGMLFSLLHVHFVIGWIL